jgi:hypothetical protein
MSPRRTIWLAFVLLAVTSSLLVAALVLRGLNGVLVTGETLMMLAFFLFAPVGTLIAMHRPQQPIGWFFCWIGLLYTLWSTLEAYVRFGLITEPGALPGATWAALAQLVAGPLPWMLLIYSLMIFPTGRHLTPRWQLAARSIVTGYILIIVLEVFTLPSLEPMPVLNPLSLEAASGFADLLVTVRDYLALAFVAIFAGGLVLRYRRARGVERQQLKWLTYVAMLWLIVSIVVVSSRLILSVEVSENISRALFPFVLTAMPVSVAFAILRYRLYDIDLIIRRTLVYSVLTALLALLYWGGVVGLQALLRPITGEGNDLAIVATTLAVAALSLPLRRRVQEFIDRRFYRRKYDATRTLIAFGQVARDEVDLDVLTRRLLSVVEGTIQPVHVSLWLGPAANTGGSPQVDSGTAHKEDAGLLVRS